MTIDVRWLWAFLDTPALQADQSCQFWTTVTRSTRSPVRGSSGEFSTLVPSRGDAWVKLQSVLDGPGGVHLDLDVDDVTVAAQIAQGLGAEHVGTLGDCVIVLRSPGGLAFCLTPSSDRAHHQVRTGEPDLLDQVCVDVPTETHDQETAFWSALTGWDHVTSDAAGFSYLARPADQPLRLLFQRLDEPTGPARAHLDIACVDRAATRAAHCAAGASVVEDYAFWTVLRDPTGRAYCLTDRSPTQTWVGGPHDL